MILIKHFIESVLLILSPPPSAARRAVQTRAATATQGAVVQAALTKVS
jgi:hypothetical protein